MSRTTPHLILSGSRPHNCLVPIYLALSFRNVIAKEVVRPLDSTLMEVGFLSITVATELVDQVESNKENAAVPPCPLPANTYTSAHLYQETKHAPIPGFLGNNDNIT